MTIVQIEIFIAVVALLLSGVVLWLRWRQEETTGQAERKEGKFPEL